MIPGNQIETVGETQKLITQKKLKKVFGHLDPANPPEVCPIRDILSPVSDKWSLLIFIFLGINGVLRFNGLKKYIHGISSKILAERLKFLEKDGYIERKVYTEVPIRVEYMLTDFGYSFLEKLISLLEWINVSMPEIQKKRHNLNNVLNLNN
jgi:DNA-binding HxlR family transcriptional regulator